MQKLGSTIRKRENPLEDGEKDISKKKEEPIEIAPDIMFVLSKYIAGPSNKYLNLKKWREPDTAKDLKIITPCFFRDTIDLPRNLRSISIKNSCLIDMGCFEGLMLEKLELENILSFEIAYLEKFALQSLILKNMSIEYEVLEKLVGILSPKIFDVISVRFREFSSDSVRNHFYTRLENTEIYSLRSEDSFFRPEHFFSVIRRRSIKRFCYKQGGSVVKYRALGFGYSYFMVRRFDLSPFFDSSWLDVDVLSTDRNSLVLSSIRPENTRTQFFWIENTTITSQIAKSLPKLKSLYIRDCVFEERNFYELIRTQKESLRYISFTGVDLPFDGIQYIQSTIKNCKVSFNSVTLNS